MARPDRRWAWSAGWALVLLVLVGAMVAGSSGAPQHPTLYQRTMAVAGQYKCPVCQGEPVSTSTAPEAVEIKSLIGKWLTEGRTDQQIRSSLLADYGPSILERPPATGIGLVLWVLPLALTALGALGLGLAFWRWRPASGSARPAKRAKPYQRMTLAAGLVLVAVAGGLWLADRSSSPRLPGGTVSGGPGGVGVTAELQQAAALTAKDPSAALVLYGEVLAADPGEPTALTEEAWIYAEAGYTNRAMTLLTGTEKAHPRYDLAHLYEGLVLLDYRRDRPGAAAEISWYLSHGPDPSLVALARKGLALATAAPR